MNSENGPDRRHAVANRPDGRKLRTLIISLNARFEHENPAAWYLKAACDARGSGVCGDVAVLSGTINEDLVRTFGTVAGFTPDVAALSCYVWNRDDTLRLCADLRAAIPSLVIVAGGPEVSHADGGDEYLAAGADLILAGEGEERFPDLLETLSRGAWPDQETLSGWSRIPALLRPEKLFSPCSPEYLAVLAGRIAYLESSRGCPHHCSYCLSSEIVGMTWIPLERVFLELEKLTSAGVKVVKFVDRTFNLSEERTLDLWNHLRRYRDTGITFHFEVAPDLLSDAQIALLGDLPPGLVQIEAGIQSVHPVTLMRIGRKMDVESALDRLGRVIAQGNVHVHADLIAGLPGEGYRQFAASFDRLSAIRPHHLQLGFLKLLRGTRLWREARKWGYVRRGYAPYEVIASSALSLGEMLLLKDIEETAERFANSGRFLLILQWLFQIIPSPFALFEMLADKQRQMGLMGRAVSSDALFRCMSAFLSEGMLPSPEEGMALLRLDWIRSHRNPYLPEWLSDGTARMTAGEGWLKEAFGEWNGIGCGPGDGDGNGKNECRDLRDDEVHKKDPSGGEGADSGIEAVPRVRKPSARMLLNRYHASVAVLPAAVREGVRFIPGCSATGKEENEKHTFRILIDVKKTNPVRNRPDVVALPSRGA